MNRNSSQASHINKLVYLNIVLLVIEIKLDIFPRRIPYSVPVKKVFCTKTYRNEYKPTNYLCSCYIKLVVYFYIRLEKIHHESNKYINFYTS